jgi:protease I
MAVKKLEGKKVLAVIAPRGFRDEELHQPRQLLEAQGAEVTIASTVQGTCTGMLGARVKAELALAQAQSDDFDAVLVVGGSGSPEHLWDNADLHRLLREADAGGLVIGGICLSGAALARAGVLQGRQATVYQTPQTLEELKKGGARYVARHVVIDGNVVTAEGPASARDFGREIIKRLSE